MSQTIKGTWHDDPSHLRKPTRRGFLHVGVVAGLGLTLGDYFRLTSPARGEHNFAPSKEGVCKSVIHIFMPGGITGWIDQFAAWVKKKRAGSGQAPA